MVNLLTLPFFQKFPPDLVRRLQGCAEVIDFKEGEEILRQGEENTSLYFLLEGRLQVLVDGGMVAQLETKGDLIGEMSLISQQNSNATIRAKTKASLLRIHGESLHQLAAKQGEDESYNLYKIYSDILVQKLESTNQKAKKIEAFAKDLETAHEKLEAVNASLELKVKDRTAKIAANLKELEQKNEELQASYRKMKDLYQNRDITFKSLNSLLTKNLVPLRESLKSLKQIYGSTDKRLDRVEKNVRRAIHRLEPLTASFQSETSMKSKRVLLAEPVKKQQVVAKMALGGTGVELDIVETAESAREKLAENSYDIFMFSEDFLELTEFARSRHPNLHCVFVTSRDIPQYIPTLLDHSFVPNIVFRDEEDRQFTIKNFVTTISKLAGGHLFGLDKYVAWGVEVHEVEVSRSDQRAEIIEAMDQYFAKTGVRTSNRGRLARVAEELLMNAIYDAPTGTEGQPLYNHRSRTETIILNENHRPTFRYATDGVLMALAIEDPFGALSAETLLRYLEKCYSSKGSLNDGREDKGGGGRGLHQIIESSDLVVFNLDPGKRTEVIALFNADQKAAVHRNPNLHFFSVSMGV